MASQDAINGISRIKNHDYPVTKKENHKEPSKLVAFYLNIYFYPYADVIDEIFAEYNVTKCEYKTMRTMVEADIMEFIKKLVDQQQSIRQKNKAFKDFLDLYLNFAHQVAFPLFERLMNEEHTPYCNDVHTIHGTISMDTHQILEHRKKEMVALSQRMKQRIDAQIV